jgi:uncharacterized protein (TIGR02001 family)
MVAVRAPTRTVAPPHSEASAWPVGKALAGRREPGVGDARVEESDMIRILCGLCLAIVLTVPAAAPADDPSSGPTGTSGDDASTPSVDADNEGNPWGTFSGNVAFVTDYAFRGVSQTRESYAPQGGLNWSHDSGFFAGFWGSRVNFGGGSDAYMEQDYFVGYGGSVGAMSYDLSVWYFYYPREGAFNYYEYVANAGYDLGFASLKLGFLYSPDYLAAFDDAIYVSTGFEYPIPIEMPYGLGLTLDANVGLTKAQDPIFSDDDYTDWNVGLVLSLPRGLNVSLRYVDTDESFDDADSRWIAGVGIDF